MSREMDIFFFVLELVSGIGIGLLGAYLFAPVTANLNVSIIYGFVTICAFAFIGIGIPGYFHARINGAGNKFIIGLLKAVLGIVIGLVLGGILSAITFSFLPYQISSSLIPTLTPVLCGVIGFNHGIGWRLGKGS